MLHYLLSFLLLLSSVTALARDLPRSDPLRQTLIDALHADDNPYSLTDPDHRDVKFIIKDLYRAGDFAVACYLRSVNGVVERTDAAIDVDHRAFMFDGKLWLPVYFPANPFGESVNNIDCAQQEGQALPGSEEEIKALFEEGLVNLIKEGNGIAVIRAREAHMVKVALAHGMLRTHKDVVIERAGKTLPDDDVLAFARHQCLGEEECLAAQRNAQVALKKYAVDRSISSLVWDECLVYQNANDLTQITQCIAQHRTRHECRPAMRIQHDAAEIEQCTSVIEAQCRAAYPDKTEQNHVCRFE